MKKLITLIILCLLLSGCAGDIGADPSEAYETAGYETGVNLLENGDFKDGEKHWGSYQEGGSARMIFRNKLLQVEIKSPGPVKHGVQVHYDGFTLVNGGNYTLSFTAYATAPKLMEVRPQLNGGDYHEYYLEEIQLSTEPTEFIINFTMEDDTDVVPRLALNMGFFPGEENSKMPVSVNISEVSLVLNNEVIEKTDTTRNILVNQIGYLTGVRKTAFFRGADSDRKFSVVRTDGEVVYTGRIRNKINNEAAGELTYSGDFSKVTEPGRYYIETETLGKSEEFSIGNNIFSDAFTDSMRMFYLQRCGCVLPSEYAGDFAHPVCHTDTARIHGTDDYIDVPGGWHDAGDYGRYIVPAAKTVADLLLAYRAVPGAFTDDTHIPESGNGIPDVLDEVRYELEWMLLMQRDDGGVYHKVTCADFPGFVMPEEETERLLVSPVSTCATADFAACMAMAYEDYETIDKEFAATCLNAARKAWLYLEENESSGFKNPLKVVTGEYGDYKDEDERYFASAALFRATGESRYHDAFKILMKEKFTDDLGWEDMGAYGNALYMTMDNEKQDSDTFDQIKKWMVKTADELVKLSKDNGYFTALDEYEWGSNMYALNNAMLMLMTNDIKPSDNYVYYAKAQLDYIFGANPMSVCYLTGHGATPAVNPHHRPSIAVGKPMPGMLIGGPDEKLEDPTARIALTEEPPAKCYIDNAQSYSTNEITIYWNSPLVYVMARLGAY